MTTKEKIHQLHLSEWITRFADQKASGLTVKQWCEQNGFTIHTYNYWKHILKEEVVNKALPDIGSVLPEGWLSNSGQVAQWEPEYSPTIVMFIIAPVLLYV